MLSVLDQLAWAAFELVCLDKGSTPYIIIIHVLDCTIESWPLTTESPTVTLMPLTPESPAVTLLPLTPESPAVTLLPPTPESSAVTLSRRWCASLYRLNGEENTWICFYSPQCEFKMHQNRLKKTFECGLVFICKLVHRYCSKVNTDIGWLSYMLLKTTIDSKHCTCVQTLSSNYMLLRRTTIEANIVLFCKYLLASYMLLKTTIEVNIVLFCKQNLLATCYWELPYRVGGKKLNKVLVTILLVWQLLSGFCLTHPMLCGCDIKEKSLLLLYI